MVADKGRCHLDGGDLAPLRLLLAASGESGCHAGTESVCVASSTAEGCVAVHVCP